MIKPVQMFRSYRGSWLLVLVVVAVMVTGPISSAEAARVEFQIEDRGQRIAQRAEVGGSRVYLRQAGGDASQDLLYDAEKDILFVIQHRDRSYLQIDQKVIEEVAAMMDTISGAVESQQGVLADLLSTFGVDAEQQPDMAPMKRTERTLEIGGFPCVLFQAHLDGKMQSEMCVAGNSSLQLSDPDFRTLSAFFRFGTRLLNRAGNLLSALGMTLPPMQLSKTDGLPIGMHSPEQQLKVMLQGLDRGAVDSAGFRVPEGYTRSTIPFTSG